MPEAVLAACRCWRGCPASENGENRISEKDLRIVVLGLAVDAAARGLGGSTQSNQLGVAHRLLERGRVFGRRVASGGLLVQCRSDGALRKTVSAAACVGVRVGRRVRPPLRGAEQHGRGRVQAQYFSEVSLSPSPPAPVPVQHAPLRLSLPLGRLGHL